MVRSISVIDLSAQPWDALTDASSSRCWRNCIFCSVSRVRDELTFSISTRLKNRSASGSSWLDPEACSMDSVGDEDLCERGESGESITRRVVQRFTESLWDDGCLETSGNIRTSMAVCTRRGLLLGLDAYIHSRGRRGKEWKERDANVRVAVDAIITQSIRVRGRNRDAYSG
jgi:hypothetical protein